MCRVTSVCDHKHTQNAVPQQILTSLVFLLTSEPIARPAAEFSLSPVLCMSLGFYRISLIPRTPIRDVYLQSVQRWPYTSEEPKRVQTLNFCPKPVTPANGQKPTPCPNPLISCRRRILDIPPVLPNIHYYYRFINWIRLTKEMLS